MPDTIDEQLTKYVTDAHAIEEQALAQMRVAPDIPGDARLSELFAEHHSETEGHERVVHERLETRGAGPSRIEDTAGKVSADTAGE